MPRPGDDRAGGFGRWMTAKQPGPVLIAGKRPVSEAIRAGQVRRVLAVRTDPPSKVLRALVDAARRQAVQIEWVERAALDRLGIVDHQDVVAYARPPHELDERELGSLRFDRDALVVVLDGITDPQNFGASARSAEAAGVSLMVIRRRRAAPTGGAAIRASAGSLLHLPVARVANLTRALDRLKDRGLFVVGLDHEALVSIHDAPPPPRPLALVVGAEDEGISRLVRESCDLLVSIPMRGRTESLNASAALAVGLFGYALRSAR